MTVQTYLDNRARNAILSQNEKDSIYKSITTLQARLNGYFGEDLTNHFQFGSSTRYTILPRIMDRSSDIDYMIVFDDEYSRPQTYIRRLKRFAQKHYSTSEIAQSYPTVRLELNHIKFDLVPAIKSYLEDSEYRIPAPTTSYEEWMWTAPNDFNSALTTANTKSNYKLKPAIRLLKFWNAQSGYVYDSYGLEKWASSQWFIFCSSVRDYLFDLIESLELDWGAAHWREDKVRRAKQIVARTKNYESDDMPISAELEIKKLIPS